MRPRRFLRSWASLESPRIAITSLALVMSKPVSLGTPLLGPPRPTIICLKLRSLTSRQRFQVTSWGSIRYGFPFRIDVSTQAASKLFASPTAWVSPVRCRLKSSIGITWLRPPPAAPPLIPNTGPIEG